MYNQQHNDNILKYENKIFKTRSYGDFYVIKYNNAFDVEIKFLETGTIRHVNTSAIDKGSIKDPYRPIIYGKGYIGEGEYTSRVNRIQPSCYKRWKEMLNRCYNTNNPSYSRYGKRGVIVCDEWLNYQNYAKWYYTNCKDETWALDKDFLCKNNKIYCPEYCCFIPKEINTVLTLRNTQRGKYPLGVRKMGGIFQAQINFMKKKIYLGAFKTVEEAFERYRQEKIHCLKMYADKYKDVLEERIYNAICNYPILIND